MLCLLQWMIELILTAANVSKLVCLTAVARPFGWQHNNRDSILTQLVARSCLNLDDISKTDNLLRTPVFVILHWLPFVFGSCEHRRSLISCLLRWNITSWRYVLRASRENKSNRIQSILDFDQEVDIALLDRVVNTMFTGRGQEVCRIARFAWCWYHAATDGSAYSYPIPRASWRLDQSGRNSGNV